jgi:hypothetical protein
MALEGGRVFVTAPDLDRYRVALAELLDTYVRQFPDQCYSLAFPLAVRPRATSALPSDALSVPAPSA